MALSFNLRSVFNILIYLVRKEEENVKREED